MSPPATTKTYDYDAIVGALTAARSSIYNKNPQTDQAILLTALLPHEFPTIPPPDANDIQSLLSKYKKLLKHVPLSPKLTIQYIFDSSFDPSQSAKSIVESSLNAYPGSSLLWCWLLHLEPSQENFERALDQVGFYELDEVFYDGDEMEGAESESRNFSIWTRYREFLVRNNDTNGLLNSFVWQATLPIPSNFSLPASLAAFASKLAPPPPQDSISAALAMVDERRRANASLTASRADFEQEIHISEVAEIGQGKVGAGAGSVGVATAYYNYATAVLSEKKPKNKELVEEEKEEEEEHPFVLAQKIFERGLADCPTIDNLWLEYLKAAIRSPSSASSIHNISLRSIRNCPWSAGLLEIAIATAPTSKAMAKLGTEGLSSGFLADQNSYLKVHLACARWHKAELVKLSEDFTGSDSEQDKADDLIDELRSCYKNAFKSLKKHFPKNSQQQYHSLMKSEAWSESYIVRFFSDDDDDDDKEHDSSPLNPSNMATKAWEKLVKNDNTLSTWSSYIEYLTSKMTSPQHLQALSALLRRAIARVELTEVAPLVIKYVEMEQSYQTVGNIFKAEFLGNNKMKKIAEAQQDADQNKALNSTSDSSAPRSKKRRLSDDSDDEEATKQHFVMAGHLKFPAHPTTVYVKNLHTKAEEYDLGEIVEKAKCGPLIHIRIIRDKKSQESKGAALIQFEESVSVERCLKLSDVVSVHGMALVIERSRYPAITSYVPRASKVKLIKTKPVTAETEASGSATTATTTKTKTATTTTTTTKTTTTKPKPKFLMKPGAIVIKKKKKFLSPSPKSEEEDVDMDTSMDNSNSISPPKSNAQFANLYKS